MGIRRKLFCYNLRQARIQETKQLCSQIDSKEAAIISTLSFDYFDSYSNNNGIRHGFKEIDIIQDCYENGCNLLLLSSIFGAINTSKLLCNYGTDLNICDNYGDNAISLAKLWCNYNVIELLTMRNLGYFKTNTLKKKIEIMNKQNMIINYMKLIFNKNKYFINLILNFIKDATKKHQPFSDGLSLFIFEYESNVILNEIKSIINNTNIKNKKNWLWMKHFIINSNIWFYEKNLFKKVLNLLKMETLKQNEMYLVEKINKYKSEKKMNRMLWNKVKSFNINNNNNINIKLCNDTYMNCLKTKYKKSQLLSIHKHYNNAFNPILFYDYYQYLSELLFISNMIQFEYHSANYSQIIINVFIQSKNK